MNYQTLTKPQCKKAIATTNQQLSSLKKNAHHYFEHDLQTLIECYTYQLNQLNTQLKKRN